MTSLDELLRQYHQSLPAKGEELRNVFDAVCDAAVTREQIRQLHLLLHRLAGSAGTYGYPEIARCARAQERVWAACLAQPEVTSAEVAALCEQQAAGMVVLLEVIEQASKGDCRGTFE